MTVSMEAPCNGQAGF